MYSNHNESMFQTTHTSSWLRACAIDWKGYAYSFLTKTASNIYIRGDGIIYMNNHQLREEWRLRDILLKSRRHLSCPI